MVRFALTLLNSGLEVPTVSKTHKGNVSHADIVALVRENDIETFCDYFIDGLAHQVRFQTGSERPIGSSMAQRIRCDLMSLWELLSSSREQMAELRAENSKLKQDVEGLLVRECVNSRHAENYIKENERLMEKIEQLEDSAASSLNPLAGPGYWTHLNDCSV